MSSRITSLPLPLKPLSGETVAGYAARLAHVNALDPGELKLHIRDLGGLSSTHPDLEKVPDIVEALGHLTPGHFARNARMHAMFVRCSHYSWRLGRCRHGCAKSQQPRTACLRCSRGDPTTIRSRGGAVCLTHARWHLDSRNVDVSAFPAYGRAERWLSGKLWFRGIALHTGEVQLAGRLIQAALDDVADAEPIKRADQWGVDPRGSHADIMLAAYPEVVALTGLLVDPEFLRFLLGPRFRVEAQVEIMEAAVSGVLASSGGRALHALSRAIVERSRNAVMIAYGATKNHNVKTIPCNFDKALYASARSNRACLLRHLDTVRMPVLSVPLKWGATRTRTLNRAVLQPDDLDRLMESVGAQRWSS